MSNRETSIALLAVITLVTSPLIPENSQAAQSKGGKAGAHMSSKRSANTNAQWSADPVKGWVRADERHQVRDSKPETLKKNRAKYKGNGSSKSVRN
jgi:hypothetical protein